MVSCLGLKPRSTPYFGANVVPNYPVPRHTKTTLLHPSPSGFGGDGSSWGGSVGVWGGLIISGPPHARLPLPSYPIGVTESVTISPRTRHTLCNLTQLWLVANLSPQHRNRAPGQGIPSRRFRAGLVLKTGVLATGPWVRIPPPPPFDS